MGIIITNLFEKHVLLFCPHSSSQLLPVMREVRNATQKQKRDQKMAKSGFDPLQDEKFIAY